MFKALRAAFSLPEMFRRRDFEKRLRFRDDYRILARALLDRLEFSTVLDVGCGNGFLVEEFLIAGKDSHGTEYSREVIEVLEPRLAERIQVCDFADSQGPSELVCCVEMAEHIPARRSDELVSTLARLAQRSIFFTAAPPGQKGRGHINCQPREAWLERFQLAGFDEDEAATAAVRGDLVALRTAYWLRTNAIVLRTRAVVPKPADRS